jgi:hypothetical protein
MALRFKLVNGTASSGEAYQVVDTKGLHRVIGNCNSEYNAQRVCLVMNECVTDTPMPYTYDSKRPATTHDSSPEMISVNDPELQAQLQSGKYAEELMEKLKSRLGTSVATIAELEGQLARGGLRPIATQLIDLLGLPASVTQDGSAYDESAQFIIQRLCAQLTGRSMFPVMINGKCQGS